MRWNMRFRDDDEHKREMDKVNKILSEANMQERLYLTDSYDQELLELKQLVNTNREVRDKAHHRERMRSTIQEIHEIGSAAGMTHADIDSDVLIALKGGIYRELFTPRDSDDVIDIGRKKKSSKPKPKRKPVKKVVKKCKCK